MESGVMWTWFTVRVLMEVCLFARLQTTQMQQDEWYWTHGTTSAPDGYGSTNLVGCQIFLLPLYVLLR